MPEFTGEMPVAEEGKMKQDKKTTKKMKKLSKRNKKLKKSLKESDKKLKKAKDELKIRDLIRGTERTCDRLEMENQIMKGILQMMMQAKPTAKGLPEAIIDVEDGVT